MNLGLAKASWIRSFAAIMKRKSGCTLEDLGVTNAEILDRWWSPRLSPGEAVAGYMNKYDLEEIPDR